MALDLVHLWSSPRISLRINTTLSLGKPRRTAEALLMGCTRCRSIWNKVLGGTARKCRNSTIGALCKILKERLL